MSFSAAGALATYAMWTLIGFFRAPESPYSSSNAIGSSRYRIELFARDARYWFRRKRRRNAVQLDSYAAAPARFHLGAD